MSTQFSRRVISQEYALFFFSPFFVHFFFLHFPGKKLTQIFFSFSIQLTRDAQIKMDDDDVEEENVDNAEPEAQDGKFSIKTSLRDLLHNDFTAQEKSQIELHFARFACKISSLAVLASRLIHFTQYRMLEDNNLAEFNRGRGPGLNYFNKYFTACQRGGAEFGHAQFFRLRQQWAGNLVLCDDRYNGNAINGMSQKFRTNFGNNIWSHAEERVKNLIKLKHSRASANLIKVVLFSLFDPASADPNVWHGYALLMHVDVEDVEELQATVRNIMQPPNGNFYLCNRWNWFKYVPAFWRLQRFFEAMHRKNFTLIPQFHHGRQMIPIDTSTLHKCINAFWKEKVAEGDRLNKPLVWRKLFNYQKFQSRREHKKFDFFMTCDGNQVSLLMQGPPPPNQNDVAAANEESRLAIIDKLDREHLQSYDRIFGIDLGNRLFSGVNVLDMRSGTESNNKFKSSSFRWNCGEFYIKRKRNAIYKAENSAVRRKEEARHNFPLNQALHASTGYAVVEQFRADHADTLAANTHRNERNAARAQRRVAERNEARDARRVRRGLEPLPPRPEVDHRHSTELSPMSWNFRDYHTLELMHFVDVQNQTSQDTLAHLKFKQEILKKKKISEMARQLAQTGAIQHGRVSYNEADKLARNHWGWRMRHRRRQVPPNYRKPLIICGIFQRRKYQHARGYVFTNGSYFIKELRRHADVHMLDEFRTSQHCSFCWSRLKENRNKHRFVVCEACVDANNQPIGRRYTDRDINAARNMRIVGLSELRTRLRPGPFRQDVDAQPQPRIRRKRRGEDCLDAEGRRQNRQNLRQLRKQRLRAAEQQYQDDIAHNAIA